MNKDVTDVIQAVQAKSGRGGVPGSVTAVLDRVTRNDPDALQWVAYICEGTRVERISVYLFGRRAEIRGPIGKEELEAAVERQAVNAYPAESRMDDLVSASPIPIWPQDVRQHPKLPTAFL